MKTLCLMALGMLISGASLIAQSDSITEINFSYDAAGNRETRDIVYYDGGLKSARATIEEEEIDFEKGLNVYPNPATHSLYVTLNTEVMDEEQKKLILFDNLGKVVYQTDQLEEINQIDVAPYPSSTYILKLVYGSSQREWIIIKK